ncbi:LysR substrate-binding domain-containing protein [Kitasatospora aburaviensis]
MDLALTYDYNLAPAPANRSVEVTPLWSADWVLAVPAGLDLPAASSTGVFAACAGLDWIANSRHTADETVVRTLASMAGFTPRVTHRADSLDLVQHMVAAGLGVALLPADRAPHRGAHRPAGRPRWCCAPTRWPGPDGCSGRPWPWCAPCCRSGPAAPAERGRARPHGAARQGPHHRPVCPGTDG